MPTDLLAARQHLTDANRLLGDVNQMIGPDRAQKILEAVAAADAALEDYVPEHARPEPVATEREWLDKLRAIIRTGWMPEEHGEGEAYGRALETLDAARADLAGQPVTVGARRALRAIVDMTNDHATDVPVGVLERVQAAAKRGLASIDQASPAADEDDAAPTAQMEGTYKAGYESGYADGMADRTGPVEPFDAQIEVLPLPGGRFVLILSGWPDVTTATFDHAVAEAVGAAAVLCLPHPVFLPGGLRTPADE